MRKLIYSMSVSLDGFTAGPGGDFGWSEPDAELHRFHNARVGELGAHLCGRRIYEVMRYWDTPEATTSEDEIVREFAAIWQALPKVVFSTTLQRVEGNARLATGDVAEEVARLKAEPGKDVGVGGPGLAAACVARGLVDEFQLFVYPIVLGGGTPFFPALEPPVDLELAETRTFGSRVVYLHYRRI